MASIKEFNRKIASLKNTRKITRTMKMVSASKLRRAQEAQRNARQYAREVNLLVHRLAGGMTDCLHPLMEARPVVKRILLVVFTSDKGLCGGFNNNLLRFVAARAREFEAQGIEVHYACCGKRAYNALRDRPGTDHYFENVTARPDPRDARVIADTLGRDFLAGRYDQVLLANNVFVSALSQLPSLQPMLPLRAAKFPPGTVVPVAEGFIAEPPVGELLATLVPRILVFKILHSLLENNAGEHAARMTAMDNATANAGQLIDSYTLRRNRARQAAITTELIEIVSGAEAL
ncbi:MAG: ATP synthase F1 subunit gamma [Kiritimatiellia bacterium]